MQVACVENHAGRSKIRRLGNRGIWKNRLADRDVSKPVKEKASVQVTHRLVHDGLEALSLPVLAARSGRELGQCVPELCGSCYRWCEITSKCISEQFLIVNK